MPDHTLPFDAFIDPAATLRMIADKVSLALADRATLPRTRALPAAVDSLSRANHDIKRFSPIPPFNPPRASIPRLNGARLPDRQPAPDPPHGAARPR